MSPDRMWMTVLGPVRAFLGDREIDLGAPQQRAVLAVLLAQAARPVGLGEIVDSVWGEDPPGTAANTVHRTVGNLRRALEPGLPARDSGRWLRRSGAGYWLDVDANSADLLRFRQLAGHGRAAASADPAAAVRAYAEALDLWHGPSANGVAPEMRGRPVFAALDREYLAVAREAADVALAADEAEPLMHAVTLAADRALFDEALQARLMLMLAAAGRQAAALGRYQRVRGLLSTELGIDPGAELNDAHARVLRPSASTASRDIDRDRESPAQLPADLPTFTGRGDEMTSLLSLGPDDRVSPGNVTISVISGMAGIGKTTLAVHWAHRVAPGFPDGQLFIDMRGFDPSGHVTTATEALQAMLGALGVAQHRIPVGVDAQAALFRSVTARRRLLIVLDNARDSDHVRPLLPGSASCLVIVTSRSQLTGLVATEDAHPLVLDPFSAGDAADLLRRRIGAVRASSDPTAVDDIVSLCAGLPLALAIVSARAVIHPKLPLRGLVDDLNLVRGGLDGFAGPEAAINARAVFASSYELLSPDAARLFRLLSVHPGPDITVAAATSLVGSTVHCVRHSMAELREAHLITEHAPGRYAVHDLLRAYSGELADDDVDAGSAALCRTVDHYLHTADPAVRLLSPGRGPAALGEPRSGVTPEQLGTDARALSWFLDEYAVLLAVVDLIAGTELDGHARQLAWTLDRFQRRQRYLPDHVTTQRTALAAAQRSAPALCPAGT